MSKSKFRWKKTDEENSADRGRYGNGSGGHRIGTAHMSSLEFDNYGLGDDMALCYSKGLAVCLNIVINLFFSFSI